MSLGQGLPAPLIHDAAFRRSPLATAHACLASLISQFPAHWRFVGSGESERLTIDGIDAHEFLDSFGLDTAPDIYAICAEHYRQAAEVQLSGSDDGAILWWGFGANMVRTTCRADGKPGRYTCAPSECLCRVQQLDVLVMVGRVCGTVSASFGTRWRWHSRRATAATRCSTARSQRAAPTRLR